MSKNEANNMEALTLVGEGKTRQAYETPELTIYNQAQTTMGGAVGPRPGDNVGAFTSYKVS